MGGVFSQSKTQAAAEKKQHVREKLLQSAEPWDEQKFGQITRAKVAEITSRIEAGEWTASQVLEAFMSRAVYAQQRSNCVTEVMFEQARQRAKELDVEFSKTGKLKGPLHGVPMSFKDQFDFVGVDSTVGYSQWVGNQSTVECDLGIQLSAAGAIPFVKTNVPQTMFNFECRNPLWGTTTNPYSQRHSCGGSSGGEGALIGLDGSPLGIGTDIGGSLRFPALFCGIYSLKPTFGRVSSSGSRSSTAGFEGIRVSTGPMARSVDDLIVSSKVMLGAEGSDPNVAPVPYREPNVAKKLTFGYYTFDGFIKSSPAAQRAVQEAVDALRSKDHECVEIKIPPGFFGESCQIVLGLTAADGYQGLQSHLGPDPLDQANWLTIKTTSTLPGFVKRIISWVVQVVYRDAFAATIVLAARRRSFYEYKELVVRRNALVERWRKEIWERYPVDAIIAPGPASPQVINGGCKTVMPMAPALATFNLLDVPVGIVPVTRIRDDIDALTPEWRAQQSGSTLIEQVLYNPKSGNYDTKDMQGLPVGVQVVGKKWEDEKVLTMMGVLDDALGLRSFGPGAFSAFQNRALGL